MRPLPFVWPHAVPFWFLWIVVFVPELRLERQARAMAAVHEPQDRGSVWLIVIAGRVALALAVLTAVVVPAATIGRGRDIVFVAGLVLIGAGELLRSHCRRVLGRYFTGTVSVLPGQPVVEAGAYRWVRHPAYTGAMMITVGIGVAMTNWLSLMILGVLPAVGYGIRVRAEEHALLTTIGEPYRDYMRRTTRFVPFLL